MPIAIAAAEVIVSAAAVPEAHAVALQAEPANGGCGVVLGLIPCENWYAPDICTFASAALSLPTWAIHVSSVAEWATAMVLMWRYAEVTGNPRWKGMTWGMMPALGSAMAACTWHFFYNSQELDCLVALQAGLTVLGNGTCWLAAYRIYAGAQEAKLRA